MPKSLKFINPFIHNPREKKAKHCSTCANIATQEKVCFDVGDGVTMIEKYCDECAKQATKSKG
ncbi:MAG: hypothetical protein ACREAY_09940 [Nitrososphaera sp.]|uniref:hypothetical protein n=1 Tax=Nitrososphaera sp. TaxID=1971748 RepID=UPI003D6FB0FE